MVFPPFSNQTQTILDVFWVQKIKISAQQKFKIKEPLKIGEHLSWEKWLHFGKRILVADGKCKMVSVSVQFHKHSQSQL